VNLKGLTVAELREYMIKLKLPTYRAAQIYDWLYQKQVRSWDEMTNLPLSLRESLKAQTSLGVLEIVAAETAKDQTTKYLLQLEDDQTVECVYLPEVERQTVCFSTQVGCQMGCLFCATSKCGFKRNLTAAEILEQLLLISRLNKIRIDNLVAMGQGEPLLNYDELIKALKIFNDPEGMGIGARHITISTCGYVPGIIKLGDEPWQVNLAISLHAADDDLRSYLMPINQKYSLGILMETCREYLIKTKRRITFEYTLISGINDRLVDLNKLINLLRGLLCHVNLIPFNPVVGLNFQRSKPEQIREFAISLNQAGIETTVRKERGAELAAACGQLQGRRSGCE